MSRFFMEINHKQRVECNDNKKKGESAINQGLFDHCAAAFKKCRQLTLVLLGTGGATILCALAQPFRYFKAHLLLVFVMLR